MFKNYLKLLYRNLLKNRVFSIINILGLAIGMGCSILILMWVQDELSYDKFHTNYENLYRVVLSSPMIEVAATSPPLAAVIQSEVPGVDATLRVLPANMTFHYNNQAFHERNGLFADSNFFEVFSFKLLSGNVKTALTRQNTLVLSEKLAEKYFGNRNPIGKSIIINNKEKFTVAGLMENVPGNSHLQFDYIIPMAQLRGREQMQQWDWYAMTTYLQTRPNASTELIGRQVSDLYLKAIGEPDTVQDMSFYLQPVNQIHLHSSHIQELFPRGSIRYVQVFSLIAFFILLIACINFMNLSTARSSKRSKEVGLRKVVGAHRHHLIRQFIGESILITFLALLLALMLVEFLLPVFNKLSAKNLTLDFLDINFILWLVIIALVTGIIAGSYPAIYLSKFQPAQVLKGNPKKILRGSNFRKVLVVFQFSLSIVLIISTLVVYRQLEYINKKELGYDKENVIFLTVKGEIKQHVGEISKSLEQLPEVAKISATSHVHTNLNNATNGLEWKGKKETDSNILFYTYTISSGYLNTLGINLLKGRTFLKDLATDSSNIIINETAARQMGLKEPVGTEIELLGVKGKVIGVVSDYHFKPVHEPIEPLVLTMKPKQFDYIVIKAATDNMDATLDELRSVVKKFNPKYPFEYQLLDASLNSLYQREKHMSKLFNYFASLAIFISCLGLFGLASFTVEQRTKEIGVRKVLGASVFRIFLLISKDFTKLVIIAFLVAAPMAYIAMRSWLKGFAYHTPLEPGVFLAAGALAFLIALITISYQTIKTARANPVKSLRYE